MIRTIIFLCTLAAGSAQAALFDRGGGLIYDDVLNVTWLQNASYAGKMSADIAISWAADFTYYDDVRHVTYTDWRLPAATDLGSPGCNSSRSGTDCGGQDGGR